MVVNDIEYYAYAALMRGVYELLEIVGAAIAGIRSIRLHPIIAPVPSTRKIADRHDFDSRHTEIRQMVKSIDCGFERALRGKSADMEFIKNYFAPRSSPPIHTPWVVVRVYDFTWPMYVLWLES